MVNGWKTTSTGLSRVTASGNSLNIWVCESCNHKKSIGSIADLVKEGRLKDGSKVPDDIELHRPYIDDVVMDCPECGGKMQRTLK